MDADRKTRIGNGIAWLTSAVAVGVTWFILSRPKAPPPPAVTTLKLQMLLASDTEAGAAMSAEYHLKKMGKAPLAVRAIPPNLGKFGLGQSTIGPESSGWLWNIEYDVPA